MVVFVLRLVPEVRVGVTVGPGLLRICPRDCSLRAVASVVVWAGAPLALGYLVLDDVAVVEARLAAASRGVLVAVPVMALLAGGVAYSRRSWSRRTRPTSPPSRPIVASLQGHEAPDAGYVRVSKPPLEVNDADQDAPRVEKRLVSPGTALAARQ